MIRHLVQLLCILLICLFLVQCAVNPVTGKKELMFVSESQEISMGKELYPSALWGDVGGGGEFRDDQLHAYLRDIVLQIHGVSHRPNLPVDFAIQNSSVPNAWAIPGHVVITRGLLAGLGNEAEFVFVMGHEMGHVAARHSARQMTYGLLQQVGLGAASVALSGSDYANMALGVGSVGSSLLLLKYSRNDELEADRLGIEYMARLGYDPLYAISAHRNLEKISGEYLESLGKKTQERGFFEDLLSTHPRTSVRIDELRMMINRLPKVKIEGDGAYRERFQNRTAGLRDTNRIYLKYYDPAVQAYEKNRLDEAGDLIEQALEQDRRQPAFLTLQGFILLKSKDYAAAKKSFQAAMDVDKDFAPAYRGMGIVSYNQKKYREGIDYLNWSLSLLPQDALSHYFLGMSYFMMNDYTSSVPHLKAFAEVQPKHPEIHGRLGISYEQSGDVTAAYQSYVQQVNVAPDNEMGRHAASRIAALRPALRDQKR